MTELCHLKGCGEEAVIGTTAQWGPEYRVAMCERHVMERIRRIADLEDRAEAEQIVAERFKHERDEAQAQLREAQGTVAALTAALADGRGCVLCMVEIDDGGNATHEPTCLLADLPAASLAILAAAKRADAVIAEVRGLQETLIKLRPREGTVNYETIRQLGIISKEESKWEHN